MKKQFLLTGLLVLTGIFYCTLSGNSLKACDGNEAAACSAIIKPAVPAAIAVDQIDFAEDTDASFYMMTNPFIRM